MVYLKTIPIVITKIDSNIITVNKRIDSLSAVNKSVLQNNDSLILIINKLNEQINYKQVIIEDFDKLSSTYSIFITLLLGLFGVFAVIGYLTAYRPLEKTKKEAEKILDKMKNDMDNLFEQYLIKNKITLMDKALKNFEDNNISEIPNSSLYIETHMHEGYTEIQVLKVLRLIKRNHQQSIILIRSLLFTENEFIEDFYSDSLKNRTCISEALQYFAKYNKQNHIDDIISYLIDSKQFTIDMVTIAKQSPLFLNKIINNDNLVNNLNKEKLQAAYYIENSHNDLANSMDLISSKLWKKYLETTRVNNIGE